MSNLKEFPPHYLPKDTLLNNKYEIVSVLGSGGFGITYKGYDRLLDISVAIKEYYPNGFANRYCPNGLKVMISESRTVSYYNEWKEKFLTEARLLAKFSDVPGIVTVRDYFEENDTAYIVMEYLDGVNLKDWVLKNGPFEPSEICGKILPLIKSLDKIHSRNLIHRDISPENIMLMPDGELKLYDFGAARDFAKQSGKSMSILLKPGYAPEEQYRSRGKQGPYTDVYALCATLYFCVTGVVPDESVQRVFKDELRRPSELGTNIPAVIENAIMKGMNIRTEDRFQDAKSLADALSGRSSSDNVIRISNEFRGIEAKQFDRAQLDNFTKTGIVSGDSDIVAFSDRNVRKETEARMEKDDESPEETLTALMTERKSEDISAEDMLTVVMTENKSEKTCAEDKLTVMMTENRETSSAEENGHSDEAAHEENEAEKIPANETAKKKKIPIWLPFVSAAALCLVIITVFLANRGAGADIPVSETAEAEITRESAETGTSFSTESDTPQTEITVSAKSTSSTSAATLSEIISSVTTQAPATSAAETTTTVTQEQVTTVQTTTEKTTAAATTAAETTKAKTTTTAAITKTSTAASTTKAKTTTTAAAAKTTASASTAKTKTTTAAQTSNTAASGLFEYKVYQDGIILTEYSGKLTELEIPAYIDGKQVLALGQSLFEGNKQLKSITVPEGVIELKQGVFANSVALREIQLPDSLETISASAFYGCSSLTELYIPKNVKVIELMCFGWTRLSKITVDADNKYFYSVDGVLFSRKDNSLLCYPLYKEGEEYTVPDGIEKIEWYAFDRPAFLKKLILSDSVREIDGTEYFINLAEYAVSSGNKNFKAVDGVLYSYDMTSLYYYPPAKADTEFILPETVISIEDSAFLECNNLRTVNLGDSLSYVHHDAFVCTNYAEIIYKGVSYYSFSDFYNYFN